MSNELLLHNVEEKLNKQEKDVSGRKASVIKKAVIKALLDFSNQSNEFAQAILESDKSLKDCMKAVTKNCGSCLSDIEAYRRAVQFYFPGADIKFNMIINLSASVEKENTDNKLNISLMDLI